MVKQREFVYSSQSPCVSCEKDGACNDANCELFVAWLKEKWSPYDEREKVVNDES